MDMRKIWRGFAAAAAGAAALLSLSGCAVGQPETAMDTYHYDGYLNAQWGSDPDEVANQLQLDRTQWVRLEEDQLAGMPEGTFGYAITRTTMMFGLYMDTEMYFAPSLEGVGDYIGLYAIHVHPAYRKKGYARSLCSSILEAGRALGASHSYLQVVKGNTPAKNLYESLGFEDLYTYWFRVKELSYSPKASAQRFSMSRIGS